MKNKDKKYDILSGQVIEEPSWKNFLVYIFIIILDILIGLLFGIIAATIFALVFSAFFVGYLATVYTFSFEIAWQAKSVGSILGIICIILLFTLKGWWGLLVLFGYWIMIGISIFYWRQRKKNVIK